jgi:subtilisin family serine protease
MFSVLGPEGSDRYGRKRFTGRSLIALRSDIEDRARILQTVDFLASRVELFGFDGSGNAFREEFVAFPEFGLATAPISPSLLADLVVGQPELQGHVVERERYVYGPMPLNCGEVTPDPLGEMGIGATPGGHGITVAVLDTGYAKHPDFDGRNLQTKYLIGKSAVDTDGHGTHCLGLACGPRVPTDRGIDRYGVAWDADILSIRVLLDRSEGTDTTILEGIRVAAKAGADIINMSLGSSVDFDEPYNVAFEIVARKLLDSGILLIAAAGNDPVGARNPVEHPANCPSIMAVAALDHNFKAWDFSCVEQNDCAKVDIAAPGECIISSSLNNTYARESGTSMACAFVAGVAALWAETDSRLRGRELWNALLENARDVGAERSDVGAGLVQAPQ